MSRSSSRLGADAWFQEWRASQGRILLEIDAYFAPVAVKRVPLFTHEVLGRERLEAVRDRVKTHEGLRTDQNGKLSVTLSALILVSIICTLVGGILGAFSTSAHLDRRNTARLQEVMQTLAATSPESIGVMTNEDATASTQMPSWLKAMKPKGAHAGISLVVIQ